MVPKFKFGHFIKIWCHPLLGTNCRQWLRDAEDDDNSGSDDDHDDDYKNQDKRLKGLLMGHQSSFAKKKPGGVQCNVTKYNAT